MLDYSLPQQISHIFGGVATGSCAADTWWWKDQSINSSRCRARENEVDGGSNHCLLVDARVLALVIALRTTLQRHPQDVQHGSLREPRRSISQWASQHRNICCVNETASVKGFHWVSMEMLWHVHEGLKICRLHEQLGLSVVGETRHQAAPVSSG
jgi:hypothetical protein